MTYDASSRKDVRKAEKALEAADAETKVFLAEALRSSAGRRWFYDLLGSCGVFNNIFIAEPYRDSFNSGMRSVGLAILDQLLQAEPEALVQLIKDANARRNPEQLAGSPDTGRDVEGQPSDALDDER